MNISLQNQIKKLQGDIDDIIAGYYTAPSALGPNTLSKNSVKARTIRSGNIDVSNLEAVQTKTGNLSVDGNLTIGTGGSLRSGKTSYADTSNAGFWMGIDSSVTKIRVGNIGHTSGWTWDGTSLAITGSISATSGTIGGWTISSTDLSSDTGSIGMASSGSIRFWSGSSTPSSAPFRVSSAGVLTSTSGSIGGWTIDSTGIRLGSGSTARGMDSGSTAFYAGSATPSSAPFNVTTAGALTASSGTIGGITIGASSLSAGGWSINSSGSLTAPSGTIGGGSMSFSNVTISGTLTLGVGGKIVDGDGSEWNSSGIIMKSTGIFGDTIKWQVSGSDVGAIYATNNAIHLYRASGSYVYLDQNTAQITTAGELNYFSGSNTAGNCLIRSSGDIRAKLGDAGGTYRFKVEDSSNTEVFGINSDGELVRPITNDATGLGAYFGRIPIYINGSLKYIAVYS